MLKKPHLGFNKKWQLTRLLTLLSVKNVLKSLFDTFSHARNHFLRKNKNKKKQSFFFLFTLNLCSQTNCSTFLHTMLQSKYTIFQYLLLLNIWNWQNYVTERLYAVEVTVKRSARKKKKQDLVKIASPFAVFGLVLYWWSLLTLLQGKLTSLHLKRHNWTTFTS